MPFSLVMLNLISSAMLTSPYLSYDYTEDQVTLFLVKYLICLLWLFFSVIALMTFLTTYKPFHLEHFLILFEFFCFLFSSFSSLLFSGHVGSVGLWPYLPHLLQYPLNCLPYAHSAFSLVFFSSFFLLVLFYLWLNFSWIILIITVSLPVMWDSSLIHPKFYHILQINYLGCGS